MSKSSFEQVDANLLKNEKYILAEICALIMTNSLTNFFFPNGLKLNTISGPNIFFMLQKFGVEYPDCDRITLLKPCSRALILKVGTNAFWWALQ